MEQNFKQSLFYVRQDEGGNDDDPSDHGGRTSRGITQREYDAWCKEKGYPQLDVWKAPDAHVDTIYYEEYWLPLCPSLPTGVDYLFFSMCVNGGRHKADLLLQRSVGAIADGRIGPVTRAAIKNTDPVSLVARFAAAERAFYISLHQPKYTKGWLNRVVADKAHALHMMQQEKKV